MAVSAGIRHIATALGVLSATGRINQEFFEHPFDTVAGMISDQQRRASLLRAIDELLDADTDPGSTGNPGVRAYPLVDLDRSSLALGVLMDGRVTVLSLIGRIAVDSGRGLGIHVDIPLVRAEGSTVVSPVYFDLVVRASGVETGAADGTAPSPGGVKMQDLDRHGAFFALTADRPPVKYALPTSSADKQKTAKLLAIREHVFGWKKLDSGAWSAGRRAIELAARWSVAARYGIDLWRAQVENASNRPQRVMRLVQNNYRSRWDTVLALPTIPASPIDPTKPATIGELYGSEALFAAVVDLGINTPAYLGPSMRRALVAALVALAPNVPASTPRLPLNEAFHRQLLESFLTERQLRPRTVRQAVPGNPGKMIDVTTDVRSSRRIDVAPGRVFHILTALAEPELPASVDPGLSALHRELGFPSGTYVSPTVRIAWPT